MYYSALSSPQVHAGPYKTVSDLISLFAAVYEGLVEMNAQQILRQEGHAAWWWWLCMVVVVHGGGRVLAALVVVDRRAHISANAWSCVNNS